MDARVVRPASPTRRSRTARAARHAFFIPSVVCLIGFLLVIGVMMSSATSATRRSLEIVRTNRWVRLAAASAFEEASAIIQERLKVPALTECPDTKTAVSKRSLETLDTVDWKSFARIAPTLTRAAYGPTAVEVGEVSFEPRAFTALAADYGAQGICVRESGMVQMSVEVTVRRCGQKLRRRVTAQRFAVAIPSQAPSQPAAAGAAPSMPDFMLVVSPFDVYSTEEDVK